MKARTILCDPPYKHRNILPARAGCHPSEHYEVMETKDIMEIPVHKWAAENGVLALWSPPPMIDVAIDIGRAWGARYGTAAPWMKQWPSGKPRRGGGTWFMQTWEVLLMFQFGTPGVRAHVDPGVLALMLGEPKGLFAVPPKRHHSGKPYDVHRYLEAFPGPRLELFATEEREGWTCWGYDTGWRLNEHGVEPGTDPIEPQMPLFETGKEEA